MRHGRRPHLVTTGDCRWSVAVALVLVARCSCVAAAAQAPGPVKVGVLKLTSSAPIFVGVEKGFFKEFGVEPELVYFQAAAPIATALAAGQIDVGATGLTAALYNIVLGRREALDRGRQGPRVAGLPAHRASSCRRSCATTAGCAAITDLKGKRIGVTQLGSTFHYHIGNILEKDGLTLERREASCPLQAMPAALEALKGKQVDAILLPQPFPGRRGGAGLRQGPRVGAATSSRGRSRPSSTRASSRPTARRRSPS